MLKTVGRVVSWAVVVVLLLLVLGSVVAVGVVVAVRTDLFDLDAELTATEVEALWSFVAAGVAATVTLLAGVWTWSYNNRTHALAREAEERQAAYDERTHALAREAEERQAATEERLRYESVAQFLSILTTDAGKPAAPAPTVGSILALRGLGHADIAVGVFENAVDTNRLDASSGARLISAFLLDDEATQLAATAALRQLAPTLAGETPRTFQWPDALYEGWRTELPTAARVHVAVSLSSLLSSRDLAWWAGGLSWAGIILKDAVDTDPDQHLSAGCARVLSAVATTWPEDATRLSLGDRSVSAGEIRESLERSSSTNAAPPYRDLDTAARALHVAWDIAEPSPPARS